ncbi:MAG: site-2 protease family protein, partial [Patescibacteria group bacterium]
MSLIIFILILVALIWVHELGHFSVAKFFGVRVDEFAIGFPPRLFTVQYGETRYSLNLLLVGGYVRIYGENPGEADDPRSLARKNRGTQAAVMAAGVACNVLFAWLLMSGGYMAGLPAEYTPERYEYMQHTSAVTITGVLPGSPAERAGLKAGDEIGNIITASAECSFDEKCGPMIEPDIGSQGEGVQAFIQEHANESLIFSIHRGGEQLNILVRAETGIVPDRKVVGIQMADMGILKLPPHLALLEGAVVIKNVFVSTVLGLGGLIAGVFGGGADLNDIAGPIGI